VNHSLKEYKDKGFGRGVKGISREKQKERSKPMKKFTICFSVLILAVWGSGFRGAQGQQPIELKWASPYPVGHPDYVMALDFIDLIHKHTNNKVKVNFFPAEQLGKAKDMLIICGQGVADMANVHIAYFAGQLPLNNVSCLPFYTTALEGGTIYQRLINTSQEIQEEFKKYSVKVLKGHTTPQYEVATIKRPVRSPEDCKGLKLKTGGGMFDKIGRRYGVVAVSIAATETYEAMQRGVVDGCIFNFPSIRSYRLNDLVKYITKGMRCGGYPGVVVYNQKKWDNLPQDIQKGILQASQESAKRTAAYWHEQNNEITKEFAKQGIQIYEIKPEERAKWDAPLEGVEEEYITDAEKKKVPARKVFNEFLKIAKEVTQ
jgi:TRAP-type C4-dicarboxylate transport system substrate-binding protein